MEGHDQRRGIIKERRPKKKSHAERNGQRQVRQERDQPLQCVSRMVMRRAKAVSRRGFGCVVVG